MKASKRVIFTQGGKGGVGKTTISVHLAADLARRGQRVLLIDADPQGSSLSWSTIREAVDFTVVGLPKATLHKELEQMRLDPLYSAQGKTGALSLTQGNRIQRRLYWAEFQEGIPVKSTEAIPVESILPPLLNSDI